MDGLSENVKSAIESVIKSENFQNYPSIEVTSGSEKGDGFASKSTAVTLKSKEKTVDVFIKYFPNDAPSKQMDLFKEIFNTEISFYEKVFPQVLKFQQDRKLEDVFDNVPKFYPSKTEYKGIPPLTLTNLKKSGYILRDLKEEPNEELLVKILETYANLHAVFIAMKDQQPDLYKNLSEGLVDTLAEKYYDVGMEDIIKTLIKGLIDTLDPEVDKITIDKCIEFSNTFMEFIRSVPKDVNNEPNWSIITHADCWSNNLMFKYESNRLIDLKILDWQVYRVAFPGLEAAHAFYNIGKTEALNNFNFYRMVYYKKLSNQIQKLGSDPNKLYPEEIFLEHWKKYCKFGLFLAFCTNRVAFITKDDIVDLVDNEDGKMPYFSVDFKEKDRYFGLMKSFVEHFVKNDFL